MNATLTKAVVVLVCLALSFSAGCGGWHKAGEGSALISAKLEIFKSGEGGTETFVGDRKSIEARESSQKPSHEETRIALNEKEKDTEVEKQLISAGLGERVLAAMKR